MQGALLRCWAVSRCLRQSVAIRVSGFAGCCPGLLGQTRARSARTEGRGFGMARSLCLVNDKKETRLCASGMSAVATVRTPCCGAEPERRSDLGCAEVAQIKGSMLEGCDLSRKRRGSALCHILTEVRRGRRQGRVHDSLGAAPSRFTSRPALVALGIVSRELGVFRPNGRLTWNAQEMVRYSPVEGLLDGLTATLADGRGLVQGNERAREIVGCSERLRKPLRRAGGDQPGAGWLYGRERGASMAGPPRIPASSTRRPLARS